MAWVSATMAAFAVGKGVYGAVNANQVKQRNKGYIDAAYRSAVQRQGVHEGDVRQGSAEELNARGLLQGGPQYASKTGSLTQSAYGAAPATLGAQQEADTNRELGLERQDLDSAHTQAKNENNAAYLNNLVGAAEGTASGILQAYGAKQTADATQQLTTATQNAQVNTIAQQPVPSVQVTPSAAPGISAAYNLNPAHAFGVDANDPHGTMGFGTPSPKATINGFGQSNSSFNVGG